MNKITKIALTGAPSSGKTACLETVKEHFEELGYKIVIVDETATALIEAGAKKGKTLDFELAVAKHQIEVEKNVVDNISELDDNVIIIFDRGLADCFSYLSAEDRDKLRQSIGLDYADCWGRYDAVLFLETAGMKNAYVNNSIRDESRDEAIELHNELLAVYVGHPHFRYIKAEDKMEDKLKSIVDEVADIVSGIELEKKLLIEMPSIKELEKYNICKSEIEQIYLLSDAGSHRIRKRTVNGSSEYFETLKIRITGDKCNEYEGIISAERYDELKQNADPKRKSIVKDRYYILYKGQYFELDIFPFWNDRALLELELNAVNTDESFELPPEIHVIEDVSTDKHYKNAYLAKI